MLWRPPNFSCQPSLLIRGLELFGLCTSAMFLPAITAPASSKVTVGSEGGWENCAAKEQAVANSALLF